MRRRALPTGVGAGLAVICRALARAGIIRPLERRSIGMADYKRAKMVLDKEYAIGTTDERLFGSFIEHLGRAV